MLGALASELDRVAINGSGASNQPLGVLGTADVGTVETAADVPSYPEIVSLMTNVL